jgi:hypothetical protein
MMENEEGERQLREYEKSEEFKQFEENVEAWEKEEENRRVLWTAFSEIVEKQGITKEKALELLNESIQV